LNSEASEARVGLSSEEQQVDPDLMNRSGRNGGAFEAGAMIGAVTTSNVEELSEAQLCLKSEALSETEQRLKME
jgi:hypothetical protein